MEPKMLTFAVAYFSCLVLSVWAVPVPNVAAVGAALGAVKDSIKNAALDNARSLIAKAVRGVVDALKNKVQSAITPKTDFLKGVAMAIQDAVKQAATKAALQGAVFGSGAALGAAVVAHKPHFIKHEDVFPKSYNAPPLFDGVSFPWLHKLWHPKNEGIAEAVTYEFPDEEPVEHKEVSQTFFVPQQQHETTHR